MVHTKGGSKIFKQWSIWYLNAPLVEQAHAAIMQDKLVHHPMDKSFLNLFGPYLRKKLRLSKKWEHLSKAQLVYANVLANMNETCHVTL